MSVPRRVKVRVPEPVGYEPIAGLKIRVKAYDREAHRILDHAHEIYEASAGFDTAVRDSVAEGLAYIVHAAYDAQACSVQLSELSFHEFVAKKTAEWFASRGYEDWFCQGAAVLFNTSQREVFHFLSRKVKGGLRLTKVKVA